MNVLKTTLAVMAGTLMLASCANSSEFNQGNLEGTWNLNLFEFRDINTDTVIDSYSFSGGQEYLTFDDNDSVTGNFDGSFSALYQLGSMNGKDLIIFKLIGISDYDTVEVTRFTGTEMDFTNKIDLQNNSGANTYQSFYFTKQ